MIELQKNELCFQFPEVHPGAKLRVSFERTLRIPDDGKHYDLPPGLGHFPLRHVDDFERAPKDWLAHGGVMLPMYQSEALWISFDAHSVGAHGGVEYPFAIKIATGKINAVTGGAWDNALSARKQDYCVAPEQPWLDGYCVKRGVIRQFVAMPLGEGYSAEEQLTGKAEHGGLQILVRPMKREAFERRFPKRQAVMSSHMLRSEMITAAAPSMGLAPGGMMKQEIYDDPFDYEDWAHDTHSRCFVHIANSLAWRDITGQEPPTTPATAREYTDAGLPWFSDYADGRKALEGSSTLGKLKSVFGLGQEKGKNPLPENESVQPKNVIALREGLKKDQVREGSF